MIKNSSQKAQVSYTYDSNGNIASITYGVGTATLTYTFTYDDFGNMLTIRSAGALIASYEYYSHNANVKKITYSNGFVLSYEYDNLDRMTKEKYNSV